MSMNPKTVSKNGKVRISDEVVAKVAYCAAKEVEGVVDICSSLPSYLDSIIQKKGKNTGISVKGLEDGGLRIDIGITVNYGTVIPKISKNIQEAVKAAVVSMTGLKVDCVNIHVMSVVFHD